MFLEPDLAWSASRGWPAISAAVAAARHISDRDLTWKSKIGLNPENQTSTCTSTSYFLTLILTYFKLTLESDLGDQ